jgi:L-iditol 2-dehydrogenase
MLTYVYRENKKLTLQESKMPLLTDENAIICVKATSICGTDLRTYRFGSPKIRSPRIIGHEVVGTIISIGKNVNGFSIGDRVQVAPAIGCGTCHYCHTGHSNLCDSLETIGFDYDGTFAEYMEIPSVAFARGNVSKVSEHVPDIQAVLAEPIACIMNSHQFLDIKDGDSVAIFGSGFIGCMHAELALVRGARHAIMIEVNPTRAEIAKKLNPTLKLINPIQSNLIQEILSLTGGRGVDVAIVACSVGSAQTDAMNITAKRGRVSLFGGLPNQSMGFLDSNIIHYKEISVYGVHASSPAQNRQALQWITEGRLDVSPFCTSVYSLKDIDTAFQALDNEKIMKAIIVPNA